MFEILIVYLFYFKMKHLFIKGLLLLASKVFISNLVL